MDEYKEIFMAEANEYLQVLNNCMLKMEDDPEEPDNLQEMFRIVHSLKGMSGTMGYETLTETSHKLETFMEKLKTGAFAVTQQTVDLLFEAVDVFQGLLVDPENPDEDANKAAVALIEKVAAFVPATGAEGEPGGVNAADSAEENDEKGCVSDEITGDSEELKMELQELEREAVRAALKRDEVAIWVKVDLIEDTLMKSVRAYMVIRELEQHGEIVTTEPPMQDLEDERFDNSFKLALICKSDCSEIFKGDILKIADIEKVEAATIKASEVEKKSPVAKEKVSKGNNKGSHKKEKTAPSSDEKGKGKNAVLGRVTEKTVRVETAKLDELINLIGEMVIVRNSVTETGSGFSEELDRSLGQMERVVTDLQNVSMKLRMVPIKQVFDRFPRMVRDISRELQKDVKLQISGEETELDRSIINQLSDPLVHLLRNAIDHGIESSEERLAEGKEKEGHITLNAFHESSHVIITVEDDGKGIDPEKIRTIALSKGIVDEEELSRMKDDDIINLIFYSGFSTSDKVTEVSGRGVGMDAVKKSIELMRGSVEIKSEPGKGSTFILRFPLTLAIIKALLVRTGGHIYAIPIETVRENVFLEAEQIKTINKEWVINIRGEVISLYHLGRLLGFSEGAEEEMSQEQEVQDNKEYPAVIIETRKKKAGFVVDELIGQQEVVIKSLGAYLLSMRGIAGATVLGDGRVTLIIDVVGLLDDRRVEVG